MLYKRPCSESSNTQQFLKTKKAGSAEALPAFLPYGRSLYSE